MLETFVPPCSRSKGRDSQGGAMAHRYSPRTHRKLTLPIVAFPGFLLPSFLLLGMTTPPDTAGDQPVLLFGIGVHIEPFGA